MTHTHKFQTAFAVSLALVLAACAGGSGPTPLPAAPAPLVLPPPPPPPPPAALLAPVQTSNPPAPIADGSGGTVFPLMVTSVAGDFGGDAATTSQGATISLDWATDRLSITVNNPAIAIADKTVTQGFPAGLTGSGDSRIGAGVLGRRDLNYTRFGYWWVASRGIWFENGAAWLAGYATPAGDVPASGSAVYSGDVNGIYSRPRVCLCNGDGFVSGDVRLSADFAARTISGSMTNLKLNSVNDIPVIIDPVSLNDIAFAGDLDVSRNIFAGTTRVVPGGPNVLSPNASGAIAGRFFGPSAAEVGAVWTISDDALRVIGSFGAKQ